jgi:two-component system chemotaxis response regulator CheY
MASVDYTCLLIDDSPLMRQLVMYALVRLKTVTVTEAVDGLVGIRHLATNSYDLIITDINMPFVNGLKVIQHARANERHKHVPIIVISTESALEDRRRAMALGASAYITKPIQAPQVIAAVKDLLKI